LGLAISKQLVALMEGQIGVRSEPGKGSTFWLPPNSKSRLVRPKRGGFQLRTRCICECWWLTITIPTGRSCANRLWRGRCKWAAPPVGDEALQGLRSAVGDGRPYDVALLDVQMPEMDSFTLAATIKADPALAATRLIVLTSMGHALRSAELKQLGIEAYLVKPVKQSRLFDCLVSQTCCRAATEGPADGQDPITASSPSGSNQTFAGSWCCFPPSPAWNSGKRLTTR
jgi:two-component system sensor histidine kinase/response regulator